MTDPQVRSPIHALPAEVLVLDDQDRVDVLNVTWLG
ncbi:hypothetical protein FHU38_000788 [Saccharomonospora amisosensis]|uniref:Uncharacterized protein n=1 Tax=Saccharomonospora amisosensis TaxID=1128677 RepID=A0A7X5ULY1_9PSEU|nr:hypothetical protein [Saccharomonospora amisosensis]